MPRFVLCFARLIILLLALSSVIPIAHSEDVKLREEAVALLERATNASLPGTVANYEAVVTFVVHYPDGSTKQGTYSRIAAGTPGNTAERDEETLGDYHAIRVRSGNRVSSTQGWMEPPEFRELRDQLPVHLARFDHEDVIRSIHDTSIMGRPAKCVQFETNFGSTLQQNELCMDTEHGYLVRWTVGKEYIENSDFKQVGSLWEPTHIRRSLHGVVRMEIEQSVTAIDGAVDPNVFTPPTAHWNKMFQCQTFRRAIGISTPQPPAGVGTETIDAVLTGMIRETGRTEALKVQVSSGRPELDAEAMRTVSNWTFQPGLCDGHVVTLGADFVVHFQGR
jgi:TonB family protein